jgi:hypothetical protein
LIAYGLRYGLLAPLDAVEARKRSAGHMGWMNRPPPLRRTLSRKPHSHPADAAGLRRGEGLIEIPSPPGRC